MFFGKNTPQSFRVKLVLNLFIPLLFVLSFYFILQNCHGASLFYKNILALAMTLLLESKKWGVPHESHKFIDWFNEVP
jgi:hypothetical protein